MQKYQKTSPTQPEVLNTFFSLVSLGHTPTVAKFLQLKYYVATYYAMRLATMAQCM